MEQLKDMSLTELKKIREEADDLIRFRERGGIRYKNVKIDWQATPHNDSVGQWCVSIITKTIDSEREKWTAISKNRERQDAIDSIPQIIENLQGLLEKTKGDKQ